MDIKWSIAEGRKKGREPTRDQQLFMDSEPSRGDVGILLMAGAYAELSTCRHLGFGAVGPIPVTAIWEWVDRHGIAGTPAADRFEQVIIAVDGETMQRQGRPKA